MEQLKGIKNFALNIKPTMLKIKEGKKLEKSELQSILQFYLEVVDYLSKGVTEELCEALRLAEGELRKMMPFGDHTNSTLERIVKARAKAR